MVQFVLNVKWGIHEFWVGSLTLFVSSAVTFFRWISESTVSSVVSWTCLTCFSTNTPRKKKQQKHLSGLCLTLINQDVVLTDLLSFVGTEWKQGESRNTILPQLSGQGSLLRWFSEQMLSRVYYGQLWYFPAFMFSEIRLCRKSNC